MLKHQFEQITIWQKETFPNATPLSKIEHLLQEVQELKNDLETQHADRRLEFADCFLLIFGAAHADGMEYDDIIACIDEKFNINRLRKWGKPDSNGVVNHIKS